MKSTLVIAIIALTATGCGTNPASIQALAEAHSKVMSQPTVTITCESGCSASYIDPRDRQQLAMPTNGWDALKHATSSVTGILTNTVPWVVVGAVAKTGIKNAGGNTSSSDSSTTDNNSVTSTDSHNVDSHNVDSHDAVSTPTVVTQPAPTVVTQPTPIVVTQPAPIIVTQPAP